jgi:hypothetical protein
VSTILLPIYFIIVMISRILYFASKSNVDAISGTCRSPGKKLTPLHFDNTQQKIHTAAKSTPLHRKYAPFLHWAEKQQRAGLNALMKEWCIGERRTFVFAALCFRLTCLSTPTAAYLC